MEMMLVIAIIVILIGMGVFGLIGVVGDAETVKAKADVETLEMNLVRYRTTTGQYPTTEQGLEALVAKPNLEPVPESWNPLMEAKNLKDPWTRPYKYLNPGKRNPSGYDIYSMGKDGIESDDDIGRW